MTRLFKLGSLYFLLILLFSIFSYSLTDPNLVLVSNSYYWSFQNLMWGTFFQNPHLLSGVYGVFIIVFFALYTLILRELKQKKLTWSLKKQIIIYLLLILPAVFSYNLLSHDVFNYIFNARLVVHYRVNPDTNLAINYQDDLWTRFMHNTHTAPPYGLVWTALSILPYLMGGGKFILTWLSFRLFALLSLILLFFSLRFFGMTMLKKKLSLYKSALLFLNPLLIIEIVVNQHNDLWMMIPAVLSFGLLALAFQKNSKFSKKYLLLGISAWIISVQTKLATLVLLPLVALFTLLSAGAGHLKLQFKKLTLLTHLLAPYIDKGRAYLPDLVTILMMLPLFTARSARFHPWYLVWLLIWIPFLKTGFMRSLVLILSFTSMLRYLPWLYLGGYPPEVLNLQVAITWSLPILYSLIKLNSLIIERKIKKTE